MNRKVPVEFIDVLLNRYSRRTNCVSVGMVCLRILLGPCSTILEAGAVFSHMHLYLV